MATKNTCFCFFRLCFLLVLFSLGLPSSWTLSSPVEIILTFDDFPMETSPLFEKKERVKIFVNKLAELDLSAAFFCIGEQVAREKGEECLSLLDPSHVVANHSYHHLHLSALPLAAFQQEIKETEALLSPHPNFRKWFRFPFLDYGDRTQLGGSEQKSQEALSFLKETGYHHGYVTINTFDWYIDGLLKKAVKEEKRIEWENLRLAYLTLLDGWMTAYHKKWRPLCGKNLVHVILFHQNDLNALFLDDIVNLIKKKQWVIVSPEKAFNTPLPMLENRTYPKINTPPTLSTTYIDEVLLAYQVFQ